MASDQTTLADPRVSELLADKNFVDFINEEVEFRVRETLQRHRSLNNVLLGSIVLLACIGLSLVVNAYSRLENTKAANDKIALVLAQVDAALKATGHDETASAAH